MPKIQYSQTHETILFAVEELRRLMLQAGKKTTSHHTAEWVNSGVQMERINLITSTEYQLLGNHDERIQIQDDGFAIIQSSNDIWIIGNEPRSVLYGVYSYVKQQFGYRFLSLDSEVISAPKRPSYAYPFIHEPMFARRGNVIETIKDPIYIDSLIDWGVKNGQNEYFFTFFLWDDLKPYITSTLKKRGVNVTLGGHSLTYLLQDILDNELTSEPKKNLSFFSEHAPLQEKVISRIVEICRENEVVTRISLWPEDIGVDSKTSADFLSHYIRFTEKLKEALDDCKLTVEVEYIVYNAGLAWNMLERENTEISNQVDGLYAYWGRDYSTGIQNEEPNQRRAFHALQDWQMQISQKSRKLTVFEYYSDHFMLSELFPPLMTRIQQDLKEYKQLGITGVLNLIVPVHQKLHDLEQKSTYPWKWIHQINNYFYARMTWGESYETVMDEYFSSFDQEGDTLKQMLVTLEELVSAHTKWNVPLFPARVVDPEKVSHPEHTGQIVEDLRKIIEYVSSLDLAKQQSMEALGNQEKFPSLTPPEMTLVYAYYVKIFAQYYLEQWELKHS